MSGQNARHPSKGAVDECVGKNPTDRGKQGVKKSLLVEADGGPLGVAITAANVHDSQVLAATLDAVVVERPKPTEEVSQHLCLDKGYDNPTGRQATVEAGYVPHIRRIGEEKWDATGEKTHPGQALGRRADAGLVKPLAWPSDPLGEEGRQLPGYAQAGVWSALVSTMAKTHRRVLR